MRQVYLASLLALASYGCGGGESLSVSPAPTASPARPPAAARSSPPRALDDRYVVVEGRPIVGDVLTNDILHGASIVEFPPADLPHGRLDLRPDGRFTYSPRAPGEEVRDTFTYAIQNASGRSSASVTLSSSLTLYVDNSQPAGGDGSAAHPYNTLGAAVTSAAGRPATFVVAHGTGTGQGLDGVYRLFPQQSVVGRSSNRFELPFVTGSFSVSENNTLKDLRLGVLGTSGVAASVNGFGCSNVSLASVRFDAPAFAPAIQLTNVTDLQLSDVHFNTVSPCVNVTGLGGMSNSVTNVSFENVSSGCVLGVGDTQTGVVVKSVTSDSSGNILDLRVGSVGSLLLNVLDCGFGALPGSSVISADVSGTAALEALFSGCTCSAIGSPRARFLDWNVRERATSVLQMEQCRLGEAVEALGLATRDQGQSTFVGRGNQFSHGNAVNLTSSGNSTSRVRLEDYTVATANFPVSLTGTDSARVDAVFAADPQRPFGVAPTFDFNGQSRLKIVNIFGTTLVNGVRKSLWSTQNVGAAPVINGVTLTVPVLESLNPQDYPNYVNVPGDLSLEAVQGAASFRGGGPSGGTKAGR